MSEAVLKAVQAKFGSEVLDTHSKCGDDTLILKREKLVSICRFLRDDPAMAFNMPIDVTAVDYQEFPDHEGPRFQVVYHFYSTHYKHRVRLKVPVEEDDATVPSVYSVWRGVNWFEREVFDMFGVKFDGHPDLRRILLYPEFEGHPLRKDYPLRGYQPLVPIQRFEGDNEDPKFHNVDLNPDIEDLLPQREG
ncbi:MAG TPA: NADH-quinone oxidoreductase subunit C [Myxococcales bacterium]|nr:NADH-quinone oxidoreductase subunit C [Myxococcales bacterium]HIN86771.1 NADH-quinone oxidoreductase subunit C [Myxococcales bacterium]